jgi:hypothetical protein
MRKCLVTEYYKYREVFAVSRKAFFTDLSCTKQIRTKLVVFLREVSPSKHKSDVCVCVCVYLKSLCGLVIESHPGVLGYQCFQTLVEWLRYRLREIILR